MSVRAGADTLKQIPLFADCDPVHLQVMAFAGDRVLFAEGEEIFRAGNKGEAAYLLTSGEAEIWRNELRERVIIATAGPGAFLGEFAMVAGVAYAVNATARRPLTATRITRDVFMRIASEFPGFGARVMGALSRRIASSVSEFDRIRPLLARPLPPPRR